MSRGGPVDELPGGARSDAAPARPRVLCVDDEPLALDGLTRVLGEQFEVMTCTNPLEALTLLERDGDFAVVIADVNMPQMNGLTFLAQVQTVSPTTTRLALTGAFIVDPVALPPEAVFRIIGKPCPPEILQEIVGNAANYHALLAASPLQPVEQGLAAKAAPGLSREPRSPWGIPGLAAALRSPVVLLSESPESSSSLEIPLRLGLRMTGRTVELLPGLTVLGRSRTCHIPIDDPKVSRRHASFSNDERELSVRNVSRTNKLLLNGVALEGEGTHRLQVGDRITVGSQEIEVCSWGDYYPSLEPTQRISILRGMPGAEEPPDESASLGKLAAIASKCARLGQTRDAARILRPRLDGLLRYCRSGKMPPQDDIRLAVDLAVGMAEAERAGSWVSYVFDLLAALGHPAEQSILERLYRIVPTTPGISTASYRSYVETLVQRQDRLGPAEKFLLRRIQGLEAAILRSAHL
ncbi:MAG: hypothetical protein RL033_5872 [Pseudomonadota bacterium]